MSRSSTYSPSLTAKVVARARRSAIRADAAPGWIRTSGNQWRFGMTEDVDVQCTSCQAPLRASVAWQPRGRLPGVGGLEGSADRDEPRAAMKKGLGPGHRVLAMASNRGAPSFDGHPAPLRTRGVRRR